jgi:hypothetical protein
LPSLSFIDGLPRAGLAAYLRAAHPGSSSHRRIG